MAKQQQATTVKFNVGGKLYEVSRSLLKRFPDTPLAKKALKAGNSTTPIFLDRDPDRFGYCLDFMRDGGILHLPEMITKASILHDLQYLGFEDIDDSLINDETSQKHLFVRHNEVVRKAHQRVATMQQEVIDLLVKMRAEEIALICFHESAQSVENEVTIKTPWDQQADIEKTTMPKFDGEKHFRESCSKLGKKVLKSDSNSVRLRKL